ncbi:unnamed protein product, partial [marine sediment metagenome]
MDRPLGRAALFVYASVRPSLGLGLTPRSLGRSLRSNQQFDSAFRVSLGLNDSKPTKTLYILNLAKIFSEILFSKWPPQKFLEG